MKTLENFCPASKFIVAKNFILTLFVLNRLNYGPRIYFFTINSCSYNFCQPLPTLMSQDRSLYYSIHECFLSCPLPTDRTTCGTLQSENLPLVKISRFTVSSRTISLSCGHFSIELWIIRFSSSKRQYLCNVQTIPQHLERLLDNTENNSLWLIA